ncbi:TonB-dependent receptor domain-containing protein [Pedobacter caeni]|uniref:Outer membrane receptor proteins, mostly Fe transport n=1 Tax=Pedobacter caeni TaxID=288992 RepID=A0A1M4V5Y7_9SPHI|nr:outer membrane beta-barrel family protein [Pedobacter caeni]SHE64355.1 Outer membrane receptor proteins, mostly Fe transport [Pedobacter caeni]
MKTRLFLLFAILCFKATAQQPSSKQQETPRQQPSSQQQLSPKAQLSAGKNKGIITGRLTDQHSKVPIAYVTISIKDQTAQSVAAAMTNEKGSFKIDDLPFGTFNVEFRFMGYQPLIKSITLSATESTAELGTLSLQEDKNLLKEVTINSEKSILSLKLDKKVFEVGKDILLQSGSLTELLNSVPSVSVSPSGVLSLRGNSNVFVLINGRRSGLTQSSALEQIPADHIERIEVITNPSSRYDAAGSAGIINIILKKNKNSGFSGQVRLVAGLPNDSRVVPSLNYKSDKVNLFSTYGFRNTDYNGLYHTQQTVTDKGITGNGLPTYMNQVQHEDRHDDGNLFYIGADYFINAQHTITAAFLRNATKDHDKTALNYDYSGSASTDSTILRKGESKESRNYNQLEFNYTRTFKDPGKKLTADMQYDFWNSDKNWNLSTTRLSPVVTERAPIRTGSIGSSKDFLVQTDLVQPLNTRSNLELGLKLENRLVSTDFKAEQQLQDSWQIIDHIDNKMDYSELIGSAYTQFNSKIKKFSYLLGLRAEATKIRIEDLGELFNRKKDYLRLFPTFHTSYEFEAGSALQFSYSKRINRPSLNLLYPFNELTDFNAQFVGNPDLNPSYANVFELSFLKKWGTFTFNPSLYYQYIKSPIQDYTYRNSNGIFISSAVNIDQEVRRGVELSILFNPLKMLSLNMELNVYQFEQAGAFGTQDFNFSGGASTARLAAQVKLPAQFGLQGRYNFSGAQSNAQSRTNAIHFVDLGLSKSLLKNKATLVLDGTNILNSRKTNTLTRGENYVLNQISRRDASRYRLSFVYRFNGKENQSVRQAKTGNRN